MVEEALSIRGILYKKNGKLIQSYKLTNYYSRKITDNYGDFIDNAKLSIDTKTGNHPKSGKSTHFNEVNQEAFDLQTYQKFISFLKFQEMMDKYNN